MNTKVMATVAVGALSALSATAFAADNAQTPDGSLTWYGVTLYGTIDAGFQYQSHGAPISDYFGPGTQELIAKSSVGSEAVIGGNYMSQSKIGLRGKEEFGNGWAGVFRLETAFNPWSGQLTDGPRSLAANNGLAAASQTSAGDSSLAGQLFNSAAFVGVSHDTYGTLTIGRNLAILHDVIGKYDPQGASYAFSPVGYSGTAAGTGDTQDRRLDSSVKYDLVFNGFHVGAQYQAKTSANPGTTQEFVVGMNFAGGSVDAFYSQKNNATAVASLSAADLKAIAGVCAGQNGAAVTAYTANYACATTPTKELAATISDNTATGIMAKYAFADKKLTAFAAFEQIKYTNASNPPTGFSSTTSYTGAYGYTGLGGYVIAKINATAFPNTKQLSISWVGVKYWVMPQMEVTGAVYHYDQNNYGNATQKGWTAGCSTIASATCSGQQNFISFAADYHVTKRFDIYGGAEWNQVQGGLASGFEFATSTVDPTLGFRYNF